MEKSFQILAKRVDALDEQDASMLRLLDRLLKLFKSRQ
jgi:hypothetical protein